MTSWRPRFHPPVVPAARRDACTSGRGRRPRSGFPVVLRRLRLARDLVGEARPLRDDAEQRGRGAARAVEARFPLADRLLARAQLVGHLLLRQAQRLAQGAHAARVPGRLVLGPPLRHGRSLHGNVYGVKWRLAECYGEGHFTENAKENQAVVKLSGTQ